MLLFLDESGTDHKEASYEVLAGLAVVERQAWPLIEARSDLQRWIEEGALDLNTWASEGQPSDFGQESGSAHRGKPN